VVFPRSLGYAQKFAAAGGDLPSKGWQVITTFKQGIYNPNIMKQQARPMCRVLFVIVWQQCLNSRRAGTSYDFQD